MAFWRGKRGDRRTTPPPPRGGATVAQGESTDLALIDGAGSRRKVFLGLDLLQRDDAVTRMVVAMRTKPGESRNWAEALVDLAQFGDDIEVQSPGMPAEPAKTRIIRALCDTMTGGPIGAGGQKIDPRNEVTHVLIECARENPEILDEVLSNYASQEPGQPWSLNSNGRTAVETLGGAGRLAIVLMAAEELDEPRRQAASQTLADIMAQKPLHDPSITPVLTGDLTQTPPNPNTRQMELAAVLLSYARVAKPEEAEALLESGIGRPGLEGGMYPRTITEPLREMLPAIRARWTEE